MRSIDTERMARFVDLAARQLEGTWVILGGAVLPLLGAAHRVTMDIDVAGPADAPQAATLVLMEIAERLGLPPETINQAGAFFLRRIRGWEKHVVCVREGPRSMICRPDATLFILLKLPRLSEADLEDCLAFLRLAGENSEAVETAGILRAIDREELRPRSRARRGRLDSLRAGLRRERRRQVREISTRGIRL